MGQRVIVSDTIAAGWALALAEPHGGLGAWRAAVDALTALRARRWLSLARARGRRGSVKTPCWSGCGFLT